MKVCWYGKEDLDSSSTLRPSDKFGIKRFQLVNCETKFILDFIVYTGSTTEYQVTSEFEMSGSVVMELMQWYLNKGHHSYVDNRYTSRALFEL